MLLCGAWVARGCHVRPGLTAERFVPDPAGGGGRCYRTGDLVRRLIGGEIEHMGRVETAGGQLDLRRRPAVDDDRPAYVAPRTDVEEALARIWAEVLGRERVGVHDDFFDLGGDSISSMRAISRVREAFEVPVPVRAVFEAPTVAELAEQVEDRAIDAILASRGVE